MNKWTVLIAGTLLLSGCGGVTPVKQVQQSASQQSLAVSGTAVVKKDTDGLFPQLESVVIQPVIEGLTNHPRLHNRPFKIVSMKGGQISPEIDELSSEVRTELSNSLRQSNAVTGRLLMQNPRRWQRHNSISELKCGDHTAPSFYLGLEMREHRGQLKLAFNAFDPDEESWINGFGTRWQGAGSQQDIQELNAIHEDESLKGLRPLPFTEDEKDLMASYLATNLSCLFGEVALDLDGKIVLYIDEAKGEKQGFVSSLFALVDNYISGLNEISITEQRDQANVVLSREAHHITGDIYQVWIKAQQRGAAVRIGGVDSNAYVRLKKNGT